MQNFEPTDCNLTLARFGICSRARLDPHQGRGLLQHLGRLYTRAQVRLAAQVAARRVVQQVWRGDRRLGAAAPRASCH